MIEDHLGRLGSADRVLSPSATEPKVSAHAGNAPLRLALAKAADGLDLAAKLLTDENHRIVFLHWANEAKAAAYGD